MTTTMNASYRDQVHGQHIGAHAPIDRPWTLLTSRWTDLLVTNHQRSEGRPDGQQLAHQLQNAQGFRGGCCCRKRCGKRGHLGEEQVAAVCQKQSCGEREST